MTNQQSRVENAYIIRDNQEYWFASPNGQDFLGVLHQIPDDGLEALTKRMEGFRWDETAQEWYRSNTLPMKIDRRFLEQHEAVFLD